MTVIGTDVTVVERPPEALPAPAERAAVGPPWPGRSASLRDTGRRTGPAANRLERLEALRGLAALYVVLHHVMPEYWVAGGVNLMLLFRFGQEAVILFFLLSGFVIHYSFTLGRDKAFGSYFARRALRIYVPFVVVLAASYLVRSYEEGAWIALYPHVLLGNLLMLQDWEWAKPGGVVRTFLGNTPLWSLSYEWWFYMLYWPLWRIFSAAGQRSVARDVVALGLPVVAAVVYMHVPVFAVRIVMYFAIWWAGALLAEAYMAGRLDRPFAMVAPLASICAVASILLFNAYVLNRDEGVPILLGRHPLLEARHFVFAAVTVVVALAWRRRRWRWFDLLTGPGRLLAPISYALYISHWFLLTEASYLSFVQNPVLEFCGYILITLTFCWLVECVLYPAVRRRVLPRRHPTSVRPRADSGSN